VNTKDVRRKPRMSVLRRVRMFVGSTMLNKHIEQTKKKFELGSTKCKVVKARRPFIRDGYNQVVKKIKSL